MKGKPIRWVDILERWGLVLADLADIGVDLYDPSTESKSWLWLRTLIMGLLTKPTTRLFRDLHSR